MVQVIRKSWLQQGGHCCSWVEPAHMQPPGSPRDLSDEGTRAATTGSQEHSDSQTSVTSMLNFGSGSSNLVIADIIQNIDHEKVRAQIRENQEKRYESARNYLLEQCSNLDQRGPKSNIRICLCHRW